MIDKVTELLKKHNITPTEWVQKQLGAFPFHPTTTIHYDPHSGIFISNAKRELHIKNDGTGIAGWDA